MPPHPVVLPGPLGDSGQCPWVSQQRRGLRMPRPVVRPCWLSLPQSCLASTFLERGCPVPRPSPPPRRVRTFSGPAPLTSAIVNTPPSDPWFLAPSSSRLSSRASPLPPLPTSSSVFLAEGLSVPTSTGMPPSRPPFSPLGDVCVPGAPGRRISMSETRSGHIRPPPSLRSGVPLLPLSPL